MSEPISMKHEHINVGDGGTAKRDATQLSADLGHQYDQGARQQAGNITQVLRQAARMATESDLGRLLASGTRLLSTLRARLVAAEHAYATGRAKLIADAERELQEFRIKTRDKLQAYDQEQARLLESLRRDIAHLEYMQEVTQ